MPMDWLVRSWYKKPPLSLLLIPFSLVYRLVVSLRRYCYRAQLFKTVYAPVPVIVVGNISVGGSGKTPLVIELARRLELAGYKPGIVSRGYGGKSESYPQHVITQSDPQQVGDEALLLARATQCPMVVDPKRPRAIKALLDANECDVIISDDGLQHYAMDRDIEIAVIDGERRLGNGFCLPAGPLREPKKRLKQVDFVVVKGQPRDGEYGMKIIPSKFISVLHFEQEQPLLAFKDLTVHAVAGIGNPHQFFDALRHLNITVIEHIFPDHHRYQEKDLAFGDDLPIVMTEKDAVKCDDFANKQLWFLAIDVETDEDLFCEIKEKLGDGVKS